MTRLLVTQDGLYRIAGRAKPILEERVNGQGKT
jgi:hypothetical protein